MTIKRNAGGAWFMKKDMESKQTREESERVAAAWLLRRADGQWSDAKQAELERWLASSPGNRVSFIRLESIWADTDRLKSIASGFPKGEVPPKGTIEKSPFFTLKQAEADAISEPEFPPVVSTWRVRRDRLAIAAGFLLVLAALMTYSAIVGTGRATYSTSIGGFSTIPTEDGSTIALNTDSRIEIHFSDKERRIELKRGEAFFDVAADPKRPFAVYAKDQKVVALGTKFSVRMESDVVHVAVTEGKVSLQEKSSAVWPIPLEKRKVAQRILLPGNVADIGERLSSVEERSLPRIEQALSWRNGYIALDGTSLAEAVAEFNRYNIRQITIDDTSLEKLQIEGNFRSNNVEGFVRLLEEGFDVKAGREPEGRIVLKKK